jgi:hypothetical protein
MKKLAKYVKPISISAFNRLSKAKKAVLVAEDVIAQIKRELYQVVTGEYVNLNVSYEAMNESARDAILAYEVVENKENYDLVLQSNSCVVCARGACLLSTIKFRNDFTIRAAKSTNLSANDSVGTNFMKDIFSLSEQALMESAFERTDMDLNGMFYLETLQSAETYGGDLSYDEDKRLISLMKNVIRNKGYFIVPRKYFSTREKYNEMVAIIKNPKKANQIKKYVECPEDDVFEEIGTDEPSFK